MYHSSRWNEWLKEKYKHLPNIALFWFVTFQLWSNIFLSMASLVLCMQLRHLFYEIKKKLAKHRNYVRIIKCMESRWITILSLVIVMKNHFSSLSIALRTSNFMYCNVKEATQSCRRLLNTPVTPSRVNWQVCPLLQQGFLQSLQLGYKIVFFCHD